MDKSLPSGRLELSWKKQRGHFNDYVKFQLEAFTGLFLSQSWRTDSCLGESEEGFLEGDA